MRSVKYIVVLLLVVLGVPKAAAQYDPSFSHYWVMETSYNPAAVGKSKFVNFVGAYNMTMA